MNTPTNPDLSEEGLRRLLAQADPAIGSEPPSDGLLERVRADAAFFAAQRDPAGASLGAGRPAPNLSAPGAVSPPSFARRHWPGLLLAAASVATLALAAGTIVPGLLNGGSDASTAAVSGLASADEATGRTGESAAGQSSTGSADTAAKTTTQYLVRSGSLLVGADDIAAARDSFVAKVTATGGRVTSESIVSRGGGELPAVSDSSALTYPYPYPSGPGVWLSVEVPAKAYESTIEAARKLGEVVQMQQSSYDVGTQVADVDARVEALESALARLKALMNRAKDVSDVIALEKAISDRQADLDSLKAQQRELSNQTTMSRISLALMSPRDARDAVDPQPHRTWWESFLEGLGQLWTWLGQALLLASPLLAAGAVIVWVRRRQKRRQTAPAPAGPPDSAAR